MALGSLPTAEWLAIGAGSFVIGWMIQFIGHAAEGRKPAFFDDLISLLIGPLFITAEFGFLVWHCLCGAIERRLQTLGERFCRPGGHRLYRRQA